MPKRTNLFQEVVEIIHRHMAEEATVEASAMLPSRSTGKLREVDVAIRGLQAGHEVIVCVEAIARSRRANREWVDQMVGKHADLPTSKLVLVSQKGFTRDAREAALANHAVPLAPEDLSGRDPEGRVVGGIRALWPKVVTFSPESLSVKFTDDDVPKEGWEEDPPLVGIDDGSVIGTLWDVAKLAYQDHFEELMEQLGLRDIEDDDVRRFKLVLLPQQGEDLQIRVDGEPRTIFVINANGRGYSVRQVVVEGKGEIMVSEIPLTHGRLGEVNVRFAYGEGKVGGREALVVASAGMESEEGQLTIRVRPLDEGT